MTLSEHVHLEIAHAVHAGHEPGDRPPLDEADSVPGCSCTRCLMLGRGADLVLTEAVEGLVRDLARVPPSKRLQVAGMIYAEADDLDLPSPGWLCRRAEEVPGAVEPETPSPGERREELPVDAARQASIVEVARAAGLEPEKSGREWAVVCPFHDDSDPSLHLNEEKGFFFCFGCHSAGDVIDFSRRLRGTDFPEAVRTLASAG